VSYKQRKLTEREEHNSENLWGFEREREALRGVYIHRVERSFLLLNGKNVAINLKIASGLLDCED